MFRYIISILILSFITSKAYGRFQDIEDADLSYDAYNREISINEDGTYEEIVEIKATLLKEQARSFFSKYNINYNGNSSSIEILAAKTIFAEQEYQVTDSMIEDKSIGINAKGFDDQKQVSIHFPNSEIGAQIYLKYKETVTKPKIDNNFFAGYYFGFDGYWQESSINIDSKLDLMLKVTDVNENLSITKNTIKDKPGYFNKASIKLKKPIFNDTINEVNSTYLNPKYITRFSVSSIDSWESLGNLLSSDYISIQKQKLPKLFLEIKNIIAQEKDIVNVINQLITHLHDRIQYFGNWQSRDGKFIPQDLGAVADKQSGDCKDFSTITATILQHLGYEANVALVMSGAWIRDLDSLPNLSSFNHAIVIVKDKNGDEYWIDPTNHVSMPDVIDPNIAGKNSLVLTEDGSFYTKIPKARPEDSKFSITKKISEQKIVDLDIELLKNHAMNLTGAGLYLSPKGIEDMVYNNFIANSILEKNKIKSIIPPLKSRIVTPVVISLKFQDPNLFFKSNLGQGYALYNDWHLIDTILAIDPTSHVNDLYIGPPGIYEKKIVFKQQTIPNLEKLNFKIDNSFIVLSRDCYLEGTDSVIYEKALIKQNWINNNQFGSEEFRALQDIIREEIINTAIIFGSK